MTLVKQALIIQIREHMEKAVEFKKKMDGAKTETKKSVYKKKLKKNNLEAADLFKALDVLVQKEAASGVENEVPVLEGRTQEKDGDKSPVE